MRIILLPKFMLIGLCAALFVAPLFAAESAVAGPPPFAAPLRWTASDALVRPASDTRGIVSVKDTSIVRYNDRWHIYRFCTGDNGRLYRSRTKIENFPNGLSDPVTLRCSFAKTWGKGVLTVASLLWLFWCSSPVCFAQNGALPSTFRWMSTDPLASPQNGSLAIKDFTCVHSNGKYIVYFTTVNSAGSWGGGMMTFNSWSEMATATQYQMPSE